jgi:hypothetical protein
MSNERIDLTELEEQFKGGLNWDDMNTMNLIAELKRCYEEIDYLNALTNSLPIEMLVEADNKLQASE